MTRGAAGLFRLTTGVNTSGGSTSRKATVSWTLSHSTVSCSREGSTTRTKACFLEPSTSIYISSSGRNLLKFMLLVQGFLFRLSIVERGRTNSGPRTVSNFRLHPSNVTLYPSFSHARMVQTYQRPSWRPSHFFLSFQKTLQLVVWEAIYEWDIKQTTLYIFVYCLYGYLVNGTWGQGCSLVVSNHSLDRAERLKQRTVCWRIVL